MHSPLRRAAKALAGLVVAAGLALAAASLGRAASIGEGATEKQVFSEKAPAPPRIGEEEALRASDPDAVYYATRLRGASNEKARRELGFRPRPLEWI